MNIEKVKLSKKHNNEVKAIYNMVDCVKQRIEYLSLELKMSDYNKFDKEKIVRRLANLRNLLIVFRGLNRRILNDD